MPSLKVPFRPQFDFRQLPDIRVMESFAYGGFVFAGVQRGIWPYDEYYWSERKGSWGGVLPMPSRECIGHLRVKNAVRETFGPHSEPLDRLPSGTTLVADGELLYRFNYYTIQAPSTPTEHRLYSCSTGQLVAQAGLGGELGTVPDGSYLLWARTFAGDLFETGHGLARVKDGEWSALRVVVGQGTWSMAFGVCPSPGAALYRKSKDAPEAILSLANEATFRRVFDPLARSVSASCVLDQSLKKPDGTTLAPAGALLLGGLRASASGPQTALWHLQSDGTSRILGLQVNFTDGVCECGKTNHFASDVVQSPAGDLFVLTECALFRFDPAAVSVTEALPGYPSQSLTHSIHSEGAHPEPGHPGGNCLRFPT